MATLGIIGDVHGQIEADDLYTRGARPYVDLIAEVLYSIQIGDMGDAESYAQLIAKVDPSRHGFIPGNHEAYGRFPPHRLGDFGAMTRPTSAWESCLMWISTQRATCLEGEHLSWTGLSRNLRRP
jgi:hypothetical protein